MPLITKEYKFCAAHKYWNSEWSEDKNQKIILLPARYSDWKGHELAIKAISKIKEKNTNYQISLVFVGNKEANNKYIIKRLNIK